MKIVFEISEEEVALILESGEYKDKEDLAMMLQGYAQDMVSEMILNIEYDKTEYND